MKTRENKSRRDFLKTGSLAAAGFFIVPRHVMGRGFIAPSDKLRIAAIGAGGKGESDLLEFSKSPNADIVFLCDVDDRQIKKSVSRFPKAKRYYDWREMLEKENKSIDAVSVSIPDNGHAVAALAAMQLGKHVYVQKPLTHYSDGQSGFIRRRRAYDAGMVSCRHYRGCNRNTSMDKPSYLAAGNGHTQQH
jgi:FlaA1/EpsC-like NDP-sugar epimerase